MAVYSIDTVWKVDIGWTEPGGFGWLVSGDQARPRILATHQRRPTNRNRQSRKNSGGFPSNACPTNWKIQPATNRAIATRQAMPLNPDATATTIETTISGMPTVWQIRFTGC